MKLLNYRYCFTSWTVLALLSRSTWVLSLLLHLFLQHREQFRLSFSFTQLKLYTSVAVGLSIVELFNSTSMSLLPGSLYMLLKGSDVGWSMTLSYVVLHKRYKIGQILAALLIMAGIGLVFVLSHQDGGEEGIPLSPSLLCLTGAFLNALCAVGTEALLKQTLQQEEQRLLTQQQQQQQQPPSKLLLSNAYSMWTSFFSFLLLMIPISVKTILYNNHQETAEQAHPLFAGCEDTTANNNTKHAQVMIPMLLLLACLGLSRFIERLSKHFICVVDSAMTFSIVQAARRLSGVYIIAILFGESFSAAMIGGSLVSSLGFALHGWCSVMNNDKKHSTSTSNYKPVATCSDMQFTASTISENDEEEEEGSSTEGTSDGIEIMAKGTDWKKSVI